MKWRQCAGNGDSDRVVELEHDLADATTGRKEQAIYASQLRKMLDRRSSELRGVRGLLAAAHKRCEELEAKLRPRRQQEGAQGARLAYVKVVPDTDSVEERVRAVERNMVRRRRETHKR